MRHPLSVVFAGAFHSFAIGPPSRIRARLPEAHPEVMELIRSIDTVLSLRFKDGAKGTQDGEWECEDPGGDEGGGRGI